MQDFPEKEPSLPQLHTQQGMREDGGSGEVEAEVPNRKLTGPPRSSGGSARVSLPSLSAIVNIQRSHLCSFPQELFLAQPAILLSLFSKRVIVSGFFFHLPEESHSNKSFNTVYLFIC
ncbi:uncharacterized [Tachysurus ichikawai]